MPLRLFAVLLGAAFLTAALALDPLRILPFHLGPFEWIALAAGSFLILFGFISRTEKRIPSLAANLFSAAFSLFLFLIVLEFSLRLIGFDFVQSEKLYYSSPIYFRQPIEPAGEIYFKRSGPAEWRGRVLTGGMRVNKIKEITEIEEKPIAVRYDSQGMRNDPPLQDWDIAMVGDSFLELGYLEDKDLFSVLTGEKLGKQVKNLGVSYTGPLNYVYILKSYGKASSTKDAVMIFYEGNDIADLKEENEALKKYRETGKRPERKFKKQTSLLHYVLSLKNSPRERSVQNAYFQSGGKEIPISVENFPKPSADLTGKEKQQLDEVFSAWAAASKEMGMTPWLVYMPAKIRVLYGSMRFSHNGTIGSNWKPNDLNSYIEGLCLKRGIQFIDVTPALREKTGRGILTYNALWDTHLNREGSHTVAQILAEKLKGATSNGIEISSKNPA